MPLLRPPAPPETGLADELKRDLSFVMDLPGRDSDAAMVRTVIDLGHRLGMTTAGPRRPASESRLLFAPDAWRRAFRHIFVTCS